LSGEVPEGGHIAAPTKAWSAEIAAALTANLKAWNLEVNGYMQFVPPGVNEELLEAADFRLIDQEDRTGSVVFSPSGSLRAMLAHRADVEAVDGKEAFARQQRYVDTVVVLSERRALS
jgi:hypothetical protein